MRYRRMNARRQPRSADRARQVQLCAGKPAAKGDPVRHAGWRYVVVGEIYRRKGPRLDQLVTDGNGVYCTTQQEDNATYEAL